MHSTFKLILSIVLTALIAAAGTGFGLYTWSQAEAEQNEIDQESTVSGLENLITTLEEENTELGKTILELEELNNEELNDESSDYELPVVVYTRPGLLNNTEEGQAEKLTLEEKLVNPFIDYYKESYGNLLTVDITVPQNIGEEYEVKAIYASGGTQGFLFGSREGEYNYWYPECMGECEFTEEFEAKYPEVVNQ